MGTHDLWLIPLVVWRFVDFLHVLILILCHLLVEHEGVNFLIFLLMVCLVFKNVWLCQCQLFHCVKMVDIRYYAVK